MESEKVKDIKEKLQEEIFIANSFGDKLRKVPTNELENLSTLINELESENERLTKQYVDWKDLYRENTKRVKQLKDRIAELEKGNEALSFAVKQGFNDCQARTLKQFAERLKENMPVHYTSVIDSIDETLKEFL